MALIKFGLGVTGMSGSVGGVTAARNRSGSYFRARTKPINPNTERQNLARSSFAALSTRWSQTLTAAQRTAWNLYAASVTTLNKLGETINLSGYNHYIRSNTFLKMRGETLVDAGPTTFELPEQDPTITCTPAAAGQAVALVFDDTMDWVDEDDAFLIIREGSPQNPQREFFSGPFLGFKDKGGSVGAPKSSPESFTTLHVLTEGQKVWYEMRIIRADGRLSNPWMVYGIVTA